MWPKYLEALDLPIDYISPCCFRKTKTDLSKYNRQFELRRLHGRSFLGGHFHEPSLVELKGDCKTKPKNG